MKKIIICTLILFIAGCIPITEDKGVWKTLPAMQTERTEVEVVLSNYQLFVIGGLDKEEGITDKVEIFSPKTGFSFGPVLPKPLHHVAAVVLNETIFVIGGYADNWMPVNSLYVLYPSAKEWVELTAMPTARGALEAGIINGKIYVIGGKADKVLATLERYDPIKDN